MPTQLPTSLGLRGPQRGATAEQLAELIRENNRIFDDVYKRLRDKFEDGTVLELAMGEALTAGSVLFSNGTNVTEDNAKLFWNNTLKRLGIGTNSPGATLQVLGGLIAGAAAHNVVIDASTGRITLVGNARAKQEIAIDIAALRIGGAITPPGQEVLAVGASGNILVETLAFNPLGAGNDEEIPLDIHLPENVDGSVDVEFHLMWVPDPNWSSGNYRWVLEYIVKDEDGSRTSGTPTTIFEDVTPVNATDFIETEFASTIDAGPQQVISARLYLDKSESTADDDGHVRFVEIEYVLNSFGEAI